MITTSVWTKYQYIIVGTKMSHQCIVSTKLGSSSKMSVQIVSAQLVPVIFLQTQHQWHCKLIVHNFIFGTTKIYNIRVITVSLCQDINVSANSFFAISSSLLSQALHQWHCTSIFLWDNWVQKPKKLGLYFCPLVKISLSAQIVFAQLGEA